MWTQVSRYCNYSFKYFLTKLFIDTNNNFKNAYYEKIASASDPIIGADSFAAIAGNGAATNY